jgi:hypothetical protein
MDSSSSGVHAQHQKQNLLFERYLMMGIALNRFFPHVVLSYEMFGTNVIASPLD